MEAQEYWDENSKVIEKGLVHSGRLEKYFSIFSLYCKLFIGKAAILKHLAIRDTATRRESYEKLFGNSWTFPLFVKAYFGEFTLGLLGRDASFFKFNKMNVGEWNLSKFKEALLRPVENFYLEYQLTGDLESGGPCYLQPNNFEIIKSRLDRIEWKEGALQPYLDITKERFDAYNLSDVFEWMGENQYLQHLTTIVNSSNVGATLVYWNFLVARERPDTLANVLKSECDLGRKLHEQQRTVMYRGLVVETVL